MECIGIICGGFSSEFDISVKSAVNIKNNFPKQFTTYLILLEKEGWSVKMEDDKIPFDQVNFSFEMKGESIEIDRFIVYIHGDPGENGKVQAYLEMMDKPYINSGPLQSQLSFDKWYCNQFLKGFGIKVAESIYLTRNDELNVSKVIQQLGLPVFVKPCDSGSSYGIARVNKEENLMAGVEAAFKEGRTVVIEEFLDGRELTCGVYRNINGVKALPITEIISKNEFFDYEAKYKGLSDEITPAQVDQSVVDLVQDLARKIYDLLQLRSIARIDFMLVNGIPYVIEVNTTPGFSNESIVPKMIGASGLTVEQFWQEVVNAEIS